MLGLKLSGLAAAAALALAAGSANAAIISLDVAGTVDAIGIPSPVFGSSVAVTGTVHFDTEGVAYQSGPYGSGTYKYYRPIGGAFEILGQTYAFGVNGAISVIDSSTDSIAFFDSSTLAGPTTDGYDPYYLALSFDGPSSLVNGPVLPTSYDDLAAITPYFQLYFNSGYSHGLRGYLTVQDPVGSPVPEPAAWALMIAGFGLAGAALRRRREIAVGTHA